jgi:hypothetical protein
LKIVLVNRNTMSQLSYENFGIYAMFAASVVKDVRIGTTPSSVRAGVALCVM